jgi:hypothetical protein
VILKQKLLLYQFLFFGEFTSNVVGNFSGRVPTAFDDCGADITISAFQKNAALRCLLPILMQTMQSQLSTVTHHHIPLSPIIERKK